MKADEQLLLDRRIPENVILLNNRVRYEDRRCKKSRFLYQLKLLCAFLAGFLMAFATLLLYDQYLVWSVQQHIAATEYYQTGYMTALQELESEENSLQQRLTTEVRVLCIVLTCPKYHESRAVHIQRTWGQRCTKLLFMSSEQNDELGSIAVIESSEDIYYKLWNKTRESFRYAYEEHLEDYDWILKADDDTYVIMENLRYMLYAYEPDLPIYFGYKMRYNDMEYMSGGASYVLSREALRRFMEESYPNSTICASGDSFDGEDVNMGKCLQNVGVLFGDSKYASDEDEKAKFFPLELLAYTEPHWNQTIPDWLLKMSAAPVETSIECCSNYSIAFHYIPPDKLYAFEFLIYNFQAFGLHRPTGKLPTKIPKSKVFEKFNNN